MLKLVSVVAVILMIICFQLSHNLAVAMEEYGVLINKRKNCDAFPTTMRRAEFEFTKYNELER